MSNAFSLAKSGGFGNTPWVNAKISTSTPTHDVERRLDEERRGHRGVASSRGSSSSQEQLDHVAAARGHDVVEADGGHSRRPRSAATGSAPRVGGAQAVEDRARAQRQVEHEEQGGQCAARPSGRPRGR